MGEKRRNDGDEFTREAVRLVTEHGYGVSETARTLWINAHRLGRWKREVEAQQRAAFRQEAREDIIDDIEIFYNSRRKHSYLGSVSPNTYEQLALVP